MAELRIIRNSKRTECIRCGAIHEYISQPSDHATCGTPAAYPADIAKKIAAMHAISAEDAVRIPTDTTIVIDDKYRQLPKIGEPQLAHFTTRERFA